MEYREIILSKHCYHDMLVVSDTEDEKYLFKV